MQGIIPWQPLNNSKHIFKKTKTLAEGRSDLSMNKNMESTKTY